MLKFSIPNNLVQSVTKFTYHLRIRAWMLTYFGIRGDEMMGRTSSRFWGSTSVMVAPVAKGGPN
jgi:hypothetical protein